jgi:NAD(P)-dependent dehydrogenase (short-subunit alcohol dehydrogenase family)
MTRTIFITGGSRGIGAATARAAAAAGYDVAITYATNAEAAAGVIRDVEKFGQKAIAIACDTVDPEAVKRAFLAFDKAFSRLDAFFNNAGIMGKAGPFIDIPTTQLVKVLAINTTSAFVAAQEAARRMAKTRGGAGGAIVNMSSMASKLGGAFEATDYAFSKGGIDTLTVGLAKELAPEGIRVNAVRPGLIYTNIHDSSGIVGRVDKYKDMVPMKRGGSAQEVADVVLYLISEQSSYVTGVLVDVAGGRGL